MSPEEKIEYVKRDIDGVFAINPKRSVRYYCSGFIVRDDSVSYDFSPDDQKSIVLKLAEENYIHIDRKEGHTFWISDYKDLFNIRLDEEKDVAELWVLTDQMIKLINSYFKSPNLDKKSHEDLYITLLEIIEDITLNGAIKWTAYKRPFTSLSMAKLGTSKKYDPAKSFKNLLFKVEKFKPKASLIKVEIHNHQSLIDEISYLTETPIGVAKKDDFSVPVKCTKKRHLESITFVHISTNPKGRVYIVLDEVFEKPIPINLTWNKSETYMKSLFMLAKNSQSSLCDYDHNVVRSINNEFYERTSIKKYMRENSLQKKQIVQKSLNKEKIEFTHKVEVKTILFVNVNSKYRHLYKDPT